MAIMSDHRSTDVTYSQEIDCEFSRISPFQFFVLAISLVLLDLQKGNYDHSYDTRKLVTNDLNHQIRHSFSNNVGRKRHSIIKKKKKKNFSLLCPI